MRCLALSMTVSAITFSGSVLANPVMIVNEVYVEQVPGTAHVQVTRTYSGGGVASTNVTRDGSTIVVAFETFPGGSRDLGSGQSSLYTVAGCDCFVPPGHHSYVVAGSTVGLDVTDESATAGTARSPSADCATQCVAGFAAPPASAGSSGTGSSAGAIGGATAMGGSGGKGTSAGAAGTAVAALGGAVAMGGNGGAPTVASQTGTTAPSVGGATGLTGDGGAPTKTPAGTSSTAPGQKNGAEDSSGCTVSRTTSGLLPIGVLGILAALALRRRT
jgi:hypothetical protein